ncbi:MAG: CDP-alcohol phosphatidyltransferase family protein [Emticicia sp.]|uniref:CDP-alcohol phosphatidyltransferase family protein n=1 Tax=Emticicia sp. TaxID=1930953 RepID=UPI003BA42AEE
MSKLAAQDKFLDFSDYGRPFAQIIANQLKNTRFTPVHLTLLFGVSGLIAVYCMLTAHYWWAGFFLILKSILDAADGELSRVKNTPSYTGRYLDSVFDIILNFVFLMTISHISDSSLTLALIAFLCIQLQGTVYNFYYVILRNNSVGGDATSKIFETETPKAFLNESQKTVNVLFKVYVMLYGIFDRTVYRLDAMAYKVRTFPNWFMTLVSLYGLGFQLLIIAMMLALNLVNFIIPFFILYTVLMVIFIGIRRLYLRS